MTSKAERREADLGVEVTPHQAIVQLIGNSFGSGDEWAGDVLYALQAAGYAVVPAKDLAKILNSAVRMVDTPEIAAARDVLWTAADAVLNPT